MKSNPALVDKGETTAVKKKGNNFAVLESILGTSLKPGRSVMVSTAPSFASQQQMGQQCSIGKKTPTQQQVTSEVLPTTMLLDRVLKGSPLTGVTQTLQKTSQLTNKPLDLGLRVRVQKKYPETKQFESFSAIGLPTWGADLKLLQQASTTPGTSAELYRNVLHTTIKKTLGTLFAEDFETRVDEELLSSEVDQFQYMLGIGNRTEPKFKPITTEQLKDIPTLLKNHGSLGQWVNKVTNPDVWRVQDISNPKSFKNKAYSESLVQVLLSLKGDEKIETQEALNDYANSITIHGKQCVIPLLLALRSHIETHMEFVIVANDLEFQKAQDPACYDATHCTYESRDEDLDEMYQLRDKGFNETLFETELQTAIHYDKVYAELKASMETVHLLTLCASGLIQSCNLRELDEISSKLGIETDQTLYLLSKFNHEIPGLSKLEFETRGDGKDVTSNSKVSNFVRGVETDGVKTSAKTKAILQDEVDSCEVMLLVSEIMDVYNNLSEEGSEKLNIFTLPFQRQAPIIILTTLVAYAYQTSKLLQHDNRVDNDDGNGVGEISSDQPFISGIFATFLEDGKGDIETLLNNIITQDIWDNICDAIVKVENFKEFHSHSEDENLSDTFVLLDDWLKGANSQFFFKDLIFSQLLDAVEVIFKEETSLSTPIQMSSPEMGRDFEITPITYCSKVLEATLRKLETHGLENPLTSHLDNLSLATPSNQLNGIKMQLKIQIARLLMLKFKDFCSQDENRERMEGIAGVLNTIKNTPNIRRNSPPFKKQLKLIDTKLKELIDLFQKIDIFADGDTPLNFTLDNLLGALKIEQLRVSQSGDIINPDKGKEDEVSDEPPIVPDTISAVRRDPPLPPEIKIRSRSYWMGFGVALVSATIPVVVGKGVTLLSDYIYNNLRWSSETVDPTTTKFVEPDISKSMGGSTNPKIVSEVLSDHLTECEISYTPAKPIPGISSGPITVPCWIPKRETILQIAPNIQNLPDIEPTPDGHIILPDNPDYYDGTKIILEKVVVEAERLFSGRFKEEHANHAKLSSYLRNIQGLSNSLKKTQNESEFAKGSIFHVSRCFLELKVFFNLLSNIDTNPLQYTNERIDSEASTRSSIFRGEDIMGLDYYTYLKATSGVMQSNTVNDYYQKQHVIGGTHAGHATNTGISGPSGSTVSGYHFQQVPKQLNKGLSKNPLDPSNNMAPKERGKNEPQERTFRASALPVVVYGTSLMLNIYNTTETLVNSTLGQYIPNIVALCTGIDAKKTKEKEPAIWKRFVTATKNSNSLGYQIGLTLRNTTAQVMLGGLVERALDAVGAIGSSSTPWSLIALSAAGVLTMSQHYFINSYQESLKGEVNKAASIYAWLRGCPLDAKLIMNFGYLAQQINSTVFEGDLYGIYMLGLRTTIFAADWRRQKALKLAFVLKKIRNEYKKKKMRDDKDKYKSFSEIFHEELMKMENEFSGTRNPVMWYLEKSVVVPLRVALDQRYKKARLLEKVEERKTQKYEQIADAELLEVVKTTHRALKEHITLIHVLYAALDVTYIYQSDSLIKNLAEQATKLNSTLTNPIDRETLKNAIGSFYNTPFDPEAGISWIFPYQTGMFIQPLVNSMSTASGYELFNWSQASTLSKFMSWPQWGFKMLSTTQIVAGSVGNIMHLYGLLKTWKKINQEFVVSLDETQRVQHYI